MARLSPDAARRFVNGYGPGAAITFHCTMCANHLSRSPAELEAQYGPNLTMGQLERRSRCTRVRWGATQPCRGRAEVGVHLPPEPEKPGIGNPLSRI